MGGSVNVMAVKRCIIIGACGLISREVAENILEGDYVICADGGYDIAAENGIVPDLVVGDMDSLSGVIKDGIETITLPREKDDTDIFRCAKEAVGMGFKEVILLAATGGRLDHTLANVSVLLFLEEMGVNSTMIDDSTEIRVLLRGEYKFDNMREKTVSVMPFGVSECVVSYKGLKYPAEHRCIPCDSPFGVSNEAVADSMEIIVHTGPAAVIITQS